MMKADGAMGFNTLNRAVTLPVDPARGTDIPIETKLIFAGTADGNEYLFPSMSKYLL
jgi:hypothetical protein